MLVTSASLKAYWKAIGGLVGPAVTALIVAWFITTPHVITDNEWVLIVTTALGGGGTVAAFPSNKPAAKPGKHLS